MHIFWLDCSVYRSSYCTVVEVIIYICLFFFSKKRRQFWIFSCLFIFFSILDIDINHSVHSVKILKKHIFLFVAMHLQNWVLYLNFQNLFSDLNSLSIIYIRNMTIFTCSFLVLFFVLFVLFVFFSFSFLFFFIFRNFKILKYWITDKNYFYIFSQYKNIKFSKLEKYIIIFNALFCVQIRENFRKKVCYFSRFFFLYSDNLSLYVLSKDWKTSLIITVVIERSKTFSNLGRENILDSRVDNYFAFINMQNQEYRKRKRKLNFLRFKWLKITARLYILLVRNGSWTMRHTSLWNEYLPITEPFPERYTWVYTDMRNKQIKLHDKTSSHLPTVV